MHGENQRLNFSKSRFTKHAVDLLHELSEEFLTGVFKDADLVRNHRGQCTVKPDDVRLALRLV